MGPEDGEFKDHNQPTLVVFNQSEIAEHDSQSEPNNICAACNQDVVQAPQSEAEVPSPAPEAAPSQT